MREIKIILVGVCARDRVRVRVRVRMRGKSEAIERAEVRRRG